MKAMSNSISHHLNDAILMAYAAGTLPEAFNLIVASHLSMCDVCRAAAESFDALGGEILDQSAAPELSEDSLAATLALLDGGPVEQLRAPKTGVSVLPQPLQDYVGGALDAV